MSEDNQIPDEFFLVEVNADASEDPLKTLSFSRSTTVLLNFAANRFTRNAARVYQSEFGIGAMDWRMLVMLTRAPGSSVAHASKTIGIDKGAVSRCLSRLEAAGLAHASCQLNDTRRKEWSLTDAGTQLHNRILKVAMARQHKLLAGFSQAEVTQFNSYLQRLLHNLEDL